MATNTFRLQYLAKAAAGVPRDLVNTFVSAKLHPIRPTVLIYNCTWVCDARCTMCNNWKWGDRKSDMTLRQPSPSWPVRSGCGRELNISGGEPTTRNDLPQMVELFQRHLPRLRKSESTRRAHADVPSRCSRASWSSAPRRASSSAFACRSTGLATSTIRCGRSRTASPRRPDDPAMQALAKTHETSRSASPRRSSRPTCRTRRTSSPGHTQELDVVFNMLRFTDAMLHNKDLEEKIGFHTREEQFMRKFFPRSRSGRIGLERTGIHDLHYADMIANGYQRTMPCPFQSRAAPQSERRSALLRELGEARKRPRRHA